jgi:hypothetical protein
LEIAGLTKWQRHLAQARSKRQAVQRLVSSTSTDANDAMSENSSDGEVFVIPEEIVDDDQVQRAYDNVLRWAEDARPKRICVNHGNSERTQFCSLKEGTDDVGIC